MTELWGESILGRIEFAKARPCDLGKLEKGRRCPEVKLGRWARAIL